MDRTVFSRGVKGLQALFGKRGCHASKDFHLQVKPLPLSIDESENPRKMAPCIFIPSGRKGNLDAEELFGEMKV